MNKEINYSGLCKLNTYLGNKFEKFERRYTLMAANSPDTSIKYFQKYGIYGNGVGSVEQRDPNTFNDDTDTSIVIFGVNDMDIHTGGVTERGKRFVERYITQAAKIEGFDPQEAIRRISYIKTSIPRAY